MALESELRRVGPITILVLRGKITLGEASQSVRNTVESLLAEGCSRIIFNLSGVLFIDSAGLGALTLSYTKTKAAGGLLKLVDPQRRVRDAIEITRLTRLFPLYASEQEAIESFADTTAQESAQPTQ